jgi:hypothetical protein
MSSATNEEAVNALRDVLNEAGPFSLDESGETWLEGWPGRMGRDGETREMVLAKEDGRAQLRGLCKKIRRDARWLVGFTRMEWKATGSADDPAISASVLEEFEAVLSSEPPDPAESRTPFCTDSR